MALADDVLDMSKLESGRLVLEEVSFDLLQLMADVTSLVNAQLLEMKLSHHTHRKNLKHTILLEVQPDLSDYAELIQQCN